MRFGLKELLTELIDAGEAGVGNQKEAALSGRGLFSA
jgi:hypothetical protein